MGHLSRPARLRDSRLVAMTAPQVSVSFSSQVGALNQQEIERRAREARMQNALEILERAGPQNDDTTATFTRFVRRTAREGLGRE